MKAFIVYMRMYAWIGRALTYIFCRKVIRRVEWFFLYRAVANDPGRARILVNMIKRVFFKSCHITELSVMLYERQGYSSLESTDDRKTLYWEAPLGITIWTKDGPAVGLAVEFRRNALCIRQLQGVAGVRMPKEFADWPRLCVETCVAFAKATKMREVRVYNADQSLFYHFPSLELKEGENMKEAIRVVRERMRRRYEGTARQAGFTKKRRWYVWMNPN